MQDTRAHETHGTTVLVVRRDGRWLIQQEKIGG